MNNACVVVCPQPRAAEIGVQVMESGGNAFDAAIATAFVQMIVDPFMCGVAGFASAQLWAPALGKHQIIDGSLRVGSRARPDMWIQDYRGRAPFSGASIFADYRSEIGYSSICVPGTIAALGELHRQYCTWPWADLLKPAIHIAREGFQATPYMRDFFLSNPYPGTPDGLTRLRASKPCACLYLHSDGSLFEVGDVIRNPDYANFLEILAARGWEEFYHGELAQTIGEDLERNGSWVTTQDLEQYRPRVQTPAATMYRGYKIFSNRSPAGGPLLLEAINILEGFDLSGLDHNGPQHLTLLADILRLVFEDRLRHLGDSKGRPMPEKVLLSKRHARHLGKTRRAMSVTPLAGRGSEHTTHLVVVDHNGNIATITHSLGYVSGVITPGLGFLYNNGMNNFEPILGRPNSITPGKIRLSTIMPTILFQDRKPRLALGASGGNAILSGCLQTISNILDFGMTAVEAVVVPRIHVEESTVWCEARIRSDTCDALKREGYVVQHQLWGYAPQLAVVQLVHLLPDGRLHGASDPRGGAGAVMQSSL